MCATRSVAAVAAHPMPTNNSYDAPESNLEPVIQAPRKMLGWKIYFWVLLTLQCLFIYGNLFDVESIGWQETVDCVIYVFVLSGIFGLAYQKKIFLNLFWRFFIPVVFLWDLFYTAMQFLEPDMDVASQISFAVILVFFLPFIFFQYLALYKYAFQSAYLWQENAQRATSV